jgi:uncharacterized protein YyaL (SSP411 family)
MAAMPDAAPMHTNRLAGETSPYLLQHAHNPVDWWPWGPDALARARLLDRPIFLSIGYAACHWCHVMERESFEDEATAAFLNDHFIPIKVDREERPDLDQIYMTAVQALTGQGGWPMSMFLTPPGRPFYGGTYFPDAPRHGMPSFRQVLEGVSQAWRQDRQGVEDAGARLVQALVDSNRTTSDTELPPSSTLDTATAVIEQQFDARHGGWGGAPKFPQPMTIEFLLRRQLATGDDRPLAVARRSLDAMADGGIHDQLGGGFHRYSTTADWLVPHFEQMLYDNGQLARVYAHAAAITGDAAYRDVADGVLDYLVRELRTPDGGFAASQDADTEGEEGGTFVWTADEIEQVVGADEADLIASYYDVSPTGNWEGKVILQRIRPRASDDVEGALRGLRRTLLAHRQTRPQPARDDKVLAAWNGLAIAAFADAGRPEPAVAAASLILEKLLVDGRLRRSWKDGRATADGVLEDYANLGEGLLDLYEATFDERWFVAARALADVILDHFVDPTGGFFDTADDHERLITRPKDPQDNAVPSGGAMATTLLLKLAALTGDGRYRDAAERALASVGTYLGRYPTGFAQWLSALDFAHAKVTEVAIVGDPGSVATRALVAVLDETYRPNLVRALSATPERSIVPLMADRVAIGGKPTAYVCLGFACRMPVTEPDALRAELEAVRG